MFNNCLKGLCHTVSLYLVRKLELVFKSSEFQRNGLVLLFKTILFRHRNCALAAVATDAKDGHGLKLEAFQVLMIHLQKSPKTEYFWFV